MFKDKAVKTPLERLGMASAVLALLSELVHDEKQQAFILQSIKILAAWSQQAGDSNEVYRHSREALAELGDAVSQIRDAQSGPTN